MLTFLEGETVGSKLSWPAWTPTARTLAKVARWLRCYHEVVSECTPPDGAVWRMGGQWPSRPDHRAQRRCPVQRRMAGGAPGRVHGLGHGGPSDRAWDLVFAAFSWVPLHARHVVAREGFTDFGSRPAWLRMFLAEYDWAGTTGELLNVVRARICAHAASVPGLAATGDPLFTRLDAQGVADDLDTAVAELNETA